MSPRPAWSRAIHARAFGACIPFGALLLLGGTSALALAGDALDPEPSIQRTLPPLPHSGPTASGLAPRALAPAKLILLSTR
jgi:hypothetical protein